MDEDALARRQARERLEGVVGGQEDDGETRGPVEVQVRRHDGDAVGRW